MHSHFTAAPAGVSAGFLFLLFTSRVTFRTARHGTAHTGRPVLAYHIDGLCRSQSTRTRRTRSTQAFAYFFCYSVWCGIGFGLWRGNWFTFVYTPSLQSTATEVQCPMEAALWDFVDSWQELCSVIIRNNVDNNSIPPTTRTYSGQTQL